MLKLTSSFYRFLMVTCDNINYTYVRNFSHINHRRKTCSLTFVRTLLFTSYISTMQQNRLFCNTKKRSHVNNTLPPNSNELRRSAPMSQSFQPTTNHASCGGDFEVPFGQDSDSPSEEWYKQFPNQSSDCSERQPIPPDFRVWEQVSKRSDSHDDKVFRFRVVSYNILAQYLLKCHPYLYKGCAPLNLKWKVRAARLYEEIMSLAPDILCLQEVQTSHLSSFYSKFEEIGYFRVFKQKTGHRQDGCAIYFKKSVFEMEDYISVEYYQPDLPLLNRDNIGIMVKLVPRCMPGSPIVVATTHLLYNPQRTDVRLAQMQVFLAEIDRFAYRGRKNEHIPIILTGDFNSTPDSAVIKLLDRGHVSASPFRDSSDWKKIGVTDNCQHLSVYLNRRAGRYNDFCKIKLYNSDYSDMESYARERVSNEAEEDFSELFNSGIIGHPLNLVSVYNKFKSDGNYEATTIQDYWVTVDYIYFSACTCLKLEERLRLPTVSECEVLGKLPNDVYGSDHLVLAAVFELKPYQSSL